MAALWKREILPWRTVRRLLLTIVIVSGAFLLYVMSLGPALYFGGVKSNQASARIPVSIRIIYYPLFEWTWLPQSYDRYLLHWTNKNLAPGEK